MKRSIRIGAAVAGGVATSAVAAAVVGRALWNRDTGRAVGRLGGGIPTGAGAIVSRFSRDELVGLPTPAARYFAFALTPGQPFVRRACLRQRGDFLMRAGRAWSPFSAVEHFAVEPPGFVWDAAIRMAPLIAVRVRDSYLDGEGAMHGKVAALVPVVDERGSPEIAAAALQRYLAEATWLPTALLPRAGVAWTAVDDNTARATLSDGGNSVWIDFRFGARGEIVGTSTQRYRSVDGKQVLTPWVGRFWDYERVQRMMVPRQGEVAWVVTEEPLPYWRGRITEFTYAFSP
jgi:hypothetical protein